VIVWCLCGGRICLCAVVYSGKSGQQLSAQPGQLSEQPGCGGETCLGVIVWCLCGGRICLCVGVK